MSVLKMKDQAIDKLALLTDAPSAEAVDSAVESDVAENVTNFPTVKCLLYVTVFSWLIRRFCIEPFNYGENNFAKIGSKEARELYQFVSDIAGPLFVDFIAQGEIALTIVLAEVAAKAPEKIEAAIRKNFDRLPRILKTSELNTSSDSWDDMYDAYAELINRYNETSEE